MIPAAARPKPIKRRPLRVLEEADAPVAELVDDAGNANTHTEENLATIASSLRRFGQPERLVVRKRDSVVFAGNGRLEVMRRLAWKTARVQYVDGTDSECRAYAVATNRTTRLSRFDDETLLETLRGFQAEDPTGGLLEASGFSVEQLAELSASLEAPAEHPMARGGAGTVATCPNCGHTFQLGGG